MSQLTSRIVMDGGKNIVVQTSGVLAESPRPELILRLGDLTDPRPKSVRLESVTFSCQDKLGVHLWWRGKDKEVFVLPLEGRGYLNFEGLQGMGSPPDTEGLALSFFGWAAPNRAILLLLDLVKQ